MKFYLLLLPAVASAWTLKTRDYNADGRFTLMSGTGTFTNGTMASEGEGSLMYNAEVIVCVPENITDSALDYLCRQNGFVSHTSASTHRVADGEGVDCDFATNSGLSTKTMNLYDCDAAAQTSSECTWGRNLFSEEECNIDDTLILACSTQRYEITDFEILANADGSLYGDDYDTSKGTVVATLKDLLTGINYKSLVKAKSNAYSYTTGRPICRKAGYSYGYFYTMSDFEYTNKLSCGYIDEHSIGRLVKNYYCSSSSNDAFDCDYDASADQGTWDLEDAMTVNCY